VKLVSKIIRKIKGKGLKFTTVADCIGMPKQPYRKEEITDIDEDEEEPFDDSVVPDTDASDISDSDMTDNATDVTTDGMTDNVTDDNNLEDEYSNQNTSSNAYSNRRSIDMCDYLLVPILLLFTRFSL
jgi:hypothetical protein